MNYSKLRLFALLALAVMVGCSEEPLDVHSTEDQHVEVQKHPDGMMRLGPQQANPYALGNMQQAYTNITGAKAELQPTHLYVRFLPRDEFELQSLRRDTTLELFDFPLDREIVGSGTHYHDPELPADAITWQYCAVPANYAFPESIHYEVLEQLFLPEVLDGAKSALADRLDDEALRLAGYAVEGPSDGSKARKRFKPSGRITVYDNTLGRIIGLQGARVVARSWFTTKHAFTDANGDFLIDHTFKGHCNYWIKWERADYDIRSGNWGQAYYNGPRLDGRWDLSIGHGGMSWVYAHIHRAAYTYYYQHSRWGIKSPPLDGKLLKQRVHIGAMDKAGRAHFYDFNKFFTTPQIKVYRYDKDNIEQRAIDLFATTIHELAHASHWEMGYSYGQYAVDYIFRKAIIPESWASCVEYVVTNDIYTGSLNFKHWSSWDYEKYSDLQSITISDCKKYGYTPLFIDCIDVQNQRNTKGELYPIDNVSGYTLAQIENVLFWSYQQLSPTAAIDPIGISDPIGLIYNSFGLRTIRNNLKTMYNNPTSGYVDELFDNYLEKEK